MAAAGQRTYAAGSQAAEEEEHQFVARLMQMGFSKGEWQAPACFAAAALTVDFPRTPQTTVRISTGCQAVDGMLGGGIQTKAITEVFDEWRTGKTQLCHTLCVTSLMGRGAGRLAYVDCEGTFRPERIRPIVGRFNLDVDFVLDNIIIARAYTFEQQFDLVPHLAGRMAEEACFNLLIMDTVTCNLRAEYMERSELTGRQQMLEKLMEWLQKVAAEFNVAVLITNQVLPAPSDLGAEPEQPAAARVAAHPAAFRLQARKGVGERLLLMVVGAPEGANLPKVGAEAAFIVTAEEEQ